jgi:hypothetical protein
MKRSPKDKLATAQDCARIDFEPWKRTPDMAKDELIPSDNALARFGVPARLACAVVFRTRDELIDMYDKVDYEEVDKMMTSISEASEGLKQILTMLDAAYIRLLAAASAHATNRLEGVDA